MAKNHTVKIHILNCGSISLLPAAAYCKGSRLTANAGSVFAPMSKRIELPNRAFLIEHPVHGRILVDTGWSRKISPNGVFDEKSAKAVLPGYLADFYHPVVQNGQTAIEQLHAMGVEPEDIDVLLLTHLDADHSCALEDFAGRVKRILFAEDEYFWSCRTVYKARQPWKLWMPWKDKTERFWYRGSDIGPNRWAFDIFDDESIICVSCPGHTDGQMTVIVKKPLGTRTSDKDGEHFDNSYVILASDVAFTHRNWEDLIIPGYGFDNEKQLLSLEWLKSVAESPNCVCCIPSHDPDFTEKTIEF